MYFKHGRYISKRECKSQKTKIDIPNLHKMLYESKKKIPKTKLKALWQTRKHTYTSLTDK